MTFKLDFDLDFDEAGSYEIGLLSKANQNDVADFETTTESYSLVDISGSYMLNMANNDLNLFWSVSNLFDKEYVDHLSRLKNLNLHDIGRNISVGLKYYFYYKLTQKKGPCALFFLALNKFGVLRLRLYPLNLTK